MSSDNAGQMCHGQGHSQDLRRVQGSTTPLEGLKSTEALRCVHMDVWSVLGGKFALPLRLYNSGYAPGHGHPLMGSSQFEAGVGIWMDEEIFNKPKKLKI